MQALEPVNLEVLEDTGDNQEWKRVVVEYHNPWHQVQEVWRNSLGKLVVQLRLEDNHSVHTVGLVEDRVVGMAPGNEASDHMAS